MTGRESHGVPRALDVLVAAYRAHLKGHALSPEIIDSPLAWLLVDDDGWRPDGMTRARSFLLRALEAYRADGSHQPRGASRADVADAVSLMWGLRGHPMGAAAAATRLGLAHGQRAVELWADAVRADQAVRDFASHETDYGAPISVARAELGERRWWPGRPADWPPTSWQRRKSMTSDEFALLSARVRSWFPVVVDGVAIPASPRLAQMLGADAAWLWVLLLRDALQTALTDWYRDAEETEHSIWVRNNVCRAWSGGELLANFLPRNDKTPHNKTYGPSVAVAAQMLAWSVDARSQVHAAAAARLQAMHELTALAHALTPADGGLVSSSVNRAQLEALGLHERDRLLRLIRPLSVDPGARAAVARFLEGSQSRSVVDPDLALETAYAVRAATDGEVKRRLVHDYLQRRPVAVASAADDDDRVALALADQSIGWDTVTMEDRELVHLIASAALAQPSGGKWGYMTHNAYRNLAVVANKQARWGDALALIDRGLADLHVLDLAGRVSDERERESSAQQLFLAGAGACVRRLEAALTMSTHRDHTDLFINVARRALWFSRAAHDSLTLLEKTGLPRQRHQDGQIATVAWRAQVRIIRLRALLGVRTAIEARLLTERDILTGWVDSPLFPLEPVPEPIGSTSKPEIVQRYRELQALEELTEAHLPTIVPLAAWVAFLNGGMLPVEDNPVTPVASAAEVLARRDDQLHMREIPLDVAELVSWLHVRRMDCLFLSWLKRSGPVYRTLDRTSGGAFSIFRACHDPLPKERCHD